MDILPDSAKTWSFEVHLVSDTCSNLAEAPMVRVGNGRATVLTDATAKKLARASLLIKKHFGNRDQDIEWVIVGDEVYIVQSRPYIEQ